MIDTFHYQGNVSISLIIKDKVVKLDGHNIGTEALKKAFCKFLTNNLVASDDLPQYIDLESSSDSITWESILLSKVPITGREWAYNTNITPNNYVATLTGNITYNDLKSVIPATSSDSFRFVLKSVNQDLAYLSVSVENVAKIAPGIQAIIQWSMQLTN